MANIINMASTAKKGARKFTLAAATAALCTSMNLNAEDTAAAKAAMHDIAQEEGNGTARALIIDFYPFHGFYA